VLAGWGGGYPLLQGRDSGQVGNERNVSRMLVFKLAVRPRCPSWNLASFVLNPPAETRMRRRRPGGALFGRSAACAHGENLRLAAASCPTFVRRAFLGNDFFYEIVLNGAMKDNAGAIKSILDHQKAESIRAYVIHRATRTAARRQPVKTCTLAEGRKSPIGLEFSRR